MSPLPTPSIIRIKPNGHGKVLVRMYYAYGSASPAEQRAAGLAMAATLLPATQHLGWQIDPIASYDPENAPWSECCITIPAVGDWRRDSVLPIGVLEAATRGMLGANGTLTIERVRD